MSFVNLHNHSYYSLLDGLPKPEEYIARAKAHGSPGIALTDHGVLYGAVEFYMAGKKQDVNPIIGCEMYLTPYSRHSRNPTIDQKRFHLILLAKNNNGYQNLIQLVTKAHLEGMYYKPRIDWELLDEYGKDLIALTSCINGEIPQAVLAGKAPEEIREIIQKYQRVFGTENFFLEMQAHFQMEEQVKVNQGLRQLSRDFHVPLVVTSDAHYVGKEDNVAQDILLCIQTDRRVDDPARLNMMQLDCSVRSPAEMGELFPDVPEALSNTLEIEKMCRVELSLGKNLMPSFPVPADKTPQSCLRELCYRGLEKRYAISLSEEEIMLLSKAPGDVLQGRPLGEIQAEEFQQLLEQSFSPEKKQVMDKLHPEQRRIVERLEYELLVINQMNFDTYFLIVQDVILWAKQQDIAVGPGRGSVGGSVVAYVLLIMDIDPLKYDLLFERFLNPARIEMPDIDMDFADTRRDEVIEYVRQKYGYDHVAQISTFGTMAAKQAVKDVGRAIGVPYAEMNEVAKLIPDRPGTKLQESLDTQVELKKLYDSNPLYKKVFDIALKLEGVVRHISVHACAVVIADEPLTQYTALQNPPNKDIVKQQKSNLFSFAITQLSAKPLTSIGLLKMDFLGLRNLSIIQKALHIIGRTKDQPIDLTTISLQDKKTFELFSRGETTGVFQFESAGMRRYLKDLKPSQFEDIIAMVALYRPGPMDWIPDYIAYKHGKKKVHYPHPELEDILKTTYGIAIYQEQILQIVQKFAGFSLGEADLLRRAIGKKIVKELMAQKEKFIAKAQEKNHTPEEAQVIFERVIEPFAHYGFNKSHAACYALISYQTAYLKAHCPAEFMAALLSSDAEDIDRVAIDVEEAHKMGIQLLPPSLNESLSNFTVVNDKTIRFGLKAIKGLGEATVDQIREERKNGAFQDVFDFAKRVPAETLNRKSLEALIYSGAMDDFSGRKSLSAMIDQLIDFARQSQEKTKSGQGSLFGLLDGPNMSETPPVPVVSLETNLEKLRWEKIYLGLYISGHPLDGLKKYFSKKADLVEHLSAKEVGKTKQILGLITRLKKLFTKNKEPMLSLTVEDPSGTMEVMIFLKVYRGVSIPLSEDMLVSVQGRLDRRNDEFLISCYEIKSVDLATAISKAKEERFYDPHQKVLRVKVMPAEEEDPLEQAEVAVIIPSPALFVEKELVQDYTIEIPYNCSRDDLMHLRQILQEQPQGEQEVFFKIQGRKIRTDVKVAPDGLLEQKIQDIVGKKIGQKTVSPEQAVS